MNVNTIIFGGRYRVATYPEGWVKTIHDPVTDRTITMKGREQVFGALVLDHIEQLFIDDAQAAQDDANA